jgi:hypothetical protein
MKENKADPAKADLPQDNPGSEKSSAQRDANMASPTAIRNTTAPRKVKDMPEDKGYRERDPEKDYAGEAGKDH